MAIVRRAMFWVVVGAVVAVWAISQHHPTHYSDTPGQGAVLQRTQLPPPDTDTGGPVPLPAPTGDQPAVHHPAQPAAVRPPVPLPPPVTDRVPAPPPQDPQLTPRPGTGGAASQPAQGTPLPGQDPIAALQPPP